MQRYNKYSRDIQISLLTSLKKCDKINLRNFSFFFTLICILLFINACNMFDGINLQFCFYILILSVIFLSKSTNENLIIAIIISCIFLGRLLRATRDRDLP